MKRRLLCALLAPIVLLAGCTPAVQPTDPSVPEDAHYLKLATAAVGDIIRNWWDGDADTASGHLKFASHGFHEEGMTVSQTCPWETSMLLHCIYDMYFLTGNEYYKNLILAEAATYHTLDPEVLECAAGDYNWASDDCAWNAIMYLCFYNVTGDTWFVDRAAGLLDSVMERWYDEEKDILYYKDDVDYMSYYEAGLALSWLRIWEITGEQRYYDLALASYERVQEHLGRDDGLYYCEATIYWPTGNKDAIGEAGSSSALAGNMCMAALSAKLYKLTGDQTYLDRVYLTNSGILKYYDKDGDGVLLNDRDAWTNATFAAFYVSEVLSLPDTEEMQALIYGTADSIYTNARTQDGYYGGTWCGPAEGDQSIWYVKGSTPQQCMTTGTSVMMITAAALLEAGVNDYVR